MPDYSKNRVLALYKILINYTDEQHQISMQDILGYMEAEGHFCSEDSILRYIKQLRNELGVDVISSRGRNAQYFIGDRLLEKEEMRLIIDSVNASNFIEKSIATKMIDKLKSTMSIYDSEELDRNVLGINIAKAENRRKIAWRNALYSEEFFKKLKLNEFSNEFVWIDMSRGCTYQCGYCGFRNRKGVAILQKDAIHEEIINLGKMDAKRVFIVDANLGGIPAIGKFIFSEFAKYAPNVKIIGYLRPEFLDDEYLAILEKSNIEELRFGIQTINENVPRWIRNNDITAVKTMLPKLKDVGVFWRAELMVGLPGDDFKALKESFRFVIDEIQPSLLFAYRLTVLHGTEVEQLCNSNVSEWVKADESSGGKVLASFSYSEKELMEMLDFSNKITNLYNKAKVIKPTYEELLDCMKNKVNSES